MTQVERRPGRRCAGRVTRLLVASVVLTAIGGPALAQTPALPEVLGPFVRDHCAQCHNPDRLTAGLDLETAGREGADLLDADAWRTVRERLAAREMPPPGRVQPSEAELEQVVAVLDTYVETLDPEPIDGPGRVTARRLNRTEYAHTVRSLLGVEGDPTADFPMDDAGYGFDNNGDVLTVSPLLMENYLTAARRLSRRAVFGVPAPDGPTHLARYMGRRSHDATGALEDASVLPFSLRGALYGSHVFDWDADYELRFRVANYRRSRRQLIAAGVIEPTEEDRRRADAVYGLTEAERRAKDLEEARQSQPPVPVVATLGGEVVTEALIEGSNAFGYERGELVARVSVEAGERAFRISYPVTADLADPRENLLADDRRVLYIDYLDIIGPFDPSREPPASYDRIFVCRHPPGEHDEECAGEVVTTLARRAYRRPVTEAEVAPLVDLVRGAEAAGDTFEDGVQLAVQAILLSPHFLFRIEHDAASGRTHPVSGHELASRLSYFLWADMPDETLFDVASTGTLHRPSVLSDQVARMLADPRSTSLIDDFAAQWLQLRALDRVKPDPERFPTVDDELRDAMQTETRLFLLETLRDDRSVLDLLDAPFTYLNGPLARHYGLDGIDGEAFQRVALSGDQRGGLLAHASVLTVSSYPTRTSPVLRGKWVLENLLGTPPPDPPVDVPALDETPGGPGRSLREQLEQHRANPTCAVCHDQIDPLGFGLEKYDATGAWRTHDGDVAIDDSGTLPDGRTFRGPGELKQVLRGEADAFRRNVAEKLLTYALGRGLERSDEAALEGIVDHARDGGDRWSAYIQGVVHSEPFRFRQPEAPSPEGVAP